MNQKLDLENLLGSHGSNLAATMRKGLQWLDDRSEPQLLRQVGQRVSDLPDFIPVTKHALQDSFGGNQTQAPDDLLVGRGLFYLTEQRRLCLDCTSGHYQMLWGYNHPDLCAAIAGAMQSGVVWDNHSNIPQAPAKQLAHQLVAVANSPDEPDPLDTVLLGVCTGSVACAAALKIQLKVYQRDRSSHGAPLIVVLDGNYHGTDMVPQFMRGLWPELVRHFEVIVLQPNDYEGLEQAFHRHGSRIAGFWAEPIMMNREAIALEADYLRQARHWCTETGALLCIDEIQTGFWLPEVFEFRALGIQPDLVVTGKGMTAGFHSLSAVLMKNRHDLLEQYDAISTNGLAALPSLVALASMELIRQNASSIRQIGSRIGRSFDALVQEFPDQLVSAQGRNYLSGLKFRSIDCALAFHRQALQAGLWCRVHAYHAGHSTLLTKLGLLANEVIVDYLVDQFRQLLKQTDASKTSHLKQAV